MNRNGGFGDVKRFSLTSILEVMTCSLHSPSQNDVRKSNLRERAFETSKRASVVFGGLILTEDIRLMDPAMRGTR